MGLNSKKTFIIYDNFQLKIKSTDIVYIAGDSGSGKSILYKQLKSDLKKYFQIRELSEIQIENIQKPIIELIGKDFQEAMYYLSLVGIGDAFIILRKFNELSDGQKYRFKLAKLLESDAQIFMSDEFCALLDRETAKIIAFNFQKLCRKLNRGLIVATSHIDLLRDLMPDLYVDKKFGKEVQVIQKPYKISILPTIFKKIKFIRATREDYKILSDFHYRSHRLGAVKEIFAFKKDNEIIGIIVLSFPNFKFPDRFKNLGKWCENKKRVNQKISLISRVIIHPKYRSIGLGWRLVKRTLEKCRDKYIEAIASMAVHNPFFEKAGMKLIKIKLPDKLIIEAIDELKKLKINPLFISSLDYNQKILKNSKIFRAVKKILIKTSLPSFIYALKKDFNFTEILNFNREKTAKLLRRLNIASETKAYLSYSRKSPK